MIPFLLLFGCVTPPSEPEPVPEEPAPVVVPDKPPLKKLAEILDAKGFVTAENDRGLVVYLQSLYFAIDSAGLPIESQGRIQSISEVMNREEFIGYGIAVERSHRQSGRSGK